MVFMTSRDDWMQYETEIRFAELFESLREGVFFSTTNGRILDANTALIRLLGFDGKAEVQARNLRDLYVHPGERDVLVREIEEKGSFRDREIQLRRKDGRVIYCLASGFAIRDTFGNVTRLQGTLVTSPSAVKSKGSCTRSRNLCGASLRTFPT